MVWQALRTETYNVPPSMHTGQKPTKGQDAVLLDSNKHVYRHAKHAGSDGGSAIKKIPMPEAESASAQCDLPVKDTTSYCRALT